MICSEYLIGSEHQQNLKEWIAQCEIAGAKVATSQQSTPKPAGEPSSPLSTSPDSASQKPKRRMSLQTNFMKR